MCVRNQRKAAEANGGTFECPRRAQNAPNVNGPEGEQTPSTIRGGRRSANTDEYKQALAARKRQQSPHPYAKGGARGLFKGPSKRAQGMGREAWCKMMEGF